MTGPGIERTGINGYGQTNPQLLMMAIRSLKLTKPSPVTSKMQGSGQSAWSQGRPMPIQVPPAASQLSVVVWTQTSFTQQAPSLGQQSTSAQVAPPVQRPL